MGDEMRGAAELLKVFLQFLQSGYGITFVLLGVIALMALAIWFIRRADIEHFNARLGQCEDQHKKAQARHEAEIKDCKQHHKECREENKHLTLGIWKFIQGDQAGAMEIIEERMRQ